MVNFRHETEEFEFKKSTSEVHDAKPIDEIRKITEN